MSSKIITPAKAPLIDAHLQPGGVYDPFGQELTHAHHIARIHHMLHERVPAFGQLVTASVKHADDPAHEAHQQLADCIGGHMRGVWHIDRYDAPIEWYAAKLTGQKEDAVVFHQLPDAIRAAADAALKRDKRTDSSEFEDGFENLFTTQGVSALWNQAANGGTANTGAAVPGVDAWFNHAQAVIGVGDSTTAAANTQFDLQAATNRFWIAMDASFPTLPGTSSNQIVFRMTAGGTQINYSWQEFAVANDNASNVTIPGSAARSAANGSMLDRVVSNQGTKGSGQTWQPSMTLSIS